MTTIFRPARRTNFTVVSNSIMNDERLSPDALGMLVYLLSRPDDWTIHRDQLMRRFDIGRDKFQSIFRDLATLGYARLESVADAETGRLSGKRWIILEEPEPMNRETENPFIGDDTDERVSRRSVFPTVGKPVPIINTDSRPITDSQPKIPPKPPAAPGVEREGLSEIDETKEPAAKGERWRRFESAWSFEGGVESVAAARREFDRLAPDDQERAIHGAAAFRGGSGRRGVYACTWLRERQWTYPRRPASATPSPAATGGGAKGKAAQRRPDGTWWLPPDSPQMQRWHEHERRTNADGRAKPGCIRPSEWPPGYAAAAGLSVFRSEAAA